MGSNISNLGGYAGDYKVELLGLSSREHMEQDRKAPEFRKAREIAHKRASDVVRNWCDISLEDRHNNPNAPHWLRDYDQKILRMLEADDARVVFRRMAGQTWPRVVCLFLLRY